MIREPCLSSQAPVQWVAPPSRADTNDDGETDDPGEDTPPAAAVPAGGDPFVAGVQFYVRANDDTCSATARPHGRCSPGEVR